MPATYRRIDYALRPAKSIERKLMVETIRRLEPLGPVSDFRYVGFGSTTFGDFVLFHKALGISDMVSIEREVGDGPRFEFNRPLGCIEIRMGLSNNVLPTLDWDPRTVLWLDYEGPIDDVALGDVSLVVSEAAPGSAVFVSLNATALLTDEMEALGNAEAATERLRKLVSPEKLPPGIQATDLRGKKTGRLFRQLLREEVQRTLKARNAGKRGPLIVESREIFNVEYRDGARMITLGLLLYKREQRNLVKGMGLDDLAWTPQDANGQESVPFQIDLPVLTVRERRHLEGQLPNTPNEQIDPAWLRDLAAGYRNFYPYFPNYVDLDG